MVKTHKITRGLGNVFDLEGVANAHGDFYRDRARLSRLHEDRERLFLWN